MADKLGLPVLVVALGAIVVAQQPGPVTPAALRNSPSMPALPQVFDTAVQKIRVSALATGLVNPWSIAFLPNPSTELGAGGLNALCLLYTSPSPRDS